jgi:hypothetical protein
MAPVQISSDCYLADLRQIRTVRTGACRRPSDGRGSSGLGIDYLQATNIQWKMQNTLDSAVLAALIRNHDEESQIAYAIDRLDAEAHLFDAKLKSTDFEFNGDGQLVGTITAAYDTVIMRIFGLDEIDVKVTATAERGAQFGNPICIMAMHPTRKHTLELHDSVSLYGLDCHIYGNSSHFDDVVDPHTPDNYITAASVTAVGYGHHYINNITPPLEGSTAVIADPFLKMALPATGACNFTNTVIVKKKTTLKPGHYCGGLTISNGSDVKLDSGVYSISGGALSIDDSKLEGEKVSIYIKSTPISLNIVNSEMSLSAPEKGLNESFVFMSDRIYSQSFMTDSIIDLEGIIYMPNSEFVWQNDNSKPKLKTKWAAWIVDGFSWTGTGTILFPYEPKKSKVPHPSELNAIPRPSLRTVVRLVN